MITVQERWIQVIRSQLENGYKPLEIYSPREVTTHEDEEEL